MCVISDYSFRQQRPDWRGRLDTRFEQVRQILSGTGVRWHFFHADEPDPTSSLRDMESRRRKLTRAQCIADVIVAITGDPRSPAAGDVVPFSHTAVIVDDNHLSEQQNVQVFAHGMAALFGGPVDPRGSGTLMTEPPESARLPSRDSRLIRRLRWYDFRAGTAALRGDWGEKAEAGLSAAYDGLPGNPAMHAHQVLGLALAADEDYKAALSHLREVVRLGPPNAGAHVQLANVLQHDFDYQAAAAEYREALRDAPNDARIHAALGVALSNMDRAREAAEQFAAALRIEPRFAMAQAGLAYVLAQQLGRIDESIAAYQAALQIDPRLPQAVQGLTQVQALKRAALENAALHRQRVQEHPADALAHLALATALARSGSLDAAVEEYRRTIELAPGIGRAHADLAMLLYLRQDYPGALREAEAAQTTGTPPPPDLLEILHNTAR